MAPYDDPDGLSRLAAGAEVITYEFENVPVQAAASVGALPGPAALEHGQDRLREKELFRSLGIPTARFGSLEEAGLPALVKTRRLGYDGKGQRRVDAPEPFETASSRRRSSTSSASCRSSAFGRGTERCVFGPSARTSTSTASCA